MDVSLSAIWVLLAGESIYELCKIDHNRKDGGFGSTSNSDGWLRGQGRDYSLGLRTFWKKRLGEFATTKALTESLRDIAVRATSEMGESRVQCSRAKHYTGSTSCTQDTRESSRLR